MFKICKAGSTIPDEFFTIKEPEQFILENPTLIYGKKDKVINVQPIFRSPKSLNFFINDENSNDDAELICKYPTLFKNTPIFNFYGLLLMDFVIILFLIGVV